MMTSFATWKSAEYKNDNRQPRVFRASVGKLYLRSETRQLQAGDYKFPVFTDNPT
jgi:hypothetical protein